MPSLTRRQKEVLDFLRNFIRERGYSPSLEEIGKGLGLSSVATVHKHLAHLRQKGFIRHEPNRKRSIEMAELAREWDFQDTFFVDKKLKRVVCLVEFFRKSEIETCPNCNIEWTNDCDSFGCWNCGHKKAPLRRV